MRDLDQLEARIHELEAAIQQNPPSDLEATTLARLAVAEVSSILAVATLESLDRALSSARAEFVSSYVTAHDYVLRIALTTQVDNPDAYVVHLQSVLDLFLDIADRTLDEAVRGIKQITATIAEQSGTQP